MADVLVDGVLGGRGDQLHLHDVTADHTIAATFAIDTYTITATAGANGTISPAGAVAVNYGADQAFTITPSTGYHVADVLVDGVSVGAVTSYTFTNVTADHTIAASFAIDTYTITRSAGANGTISPTGAVSVNYGADQAFTITPDTGYHVADVLVDGVSVGAVTSYTFTDVTANHTIAATFAIDTYTITASAGRERHDQPDRRSHRWTTALSQAFTITPSTGYHVADVLVDGVSVGAVTSYTFTKLQPTTPSRPPSPSTPTPSRHGGRERHDQPDRSSHRGLRRRPGLHITPAPATTWRTCWWTACRWAR